MTLPITMHPLSYQEEKPSDGEILGVLVGWYDADPSKVMEWLEDLNPKEAYREHMREIGAAK